MSRAINLLPKIADQEIKSGVYRKRTNLVSLAILLLTFLTLIGIFIFRTIQVRSFNDLKDQSSKKEASIKSQQVKEVILRTISSKLKRISSFLASSPKYSTYLADFSSLGNVNITDMKIEGSKVAVSMVFSDSDSLANFINNLLDKDLGGKKFNNIELVTLTFNAKDASYKVALTLEKVK